MSGPKLRVFISGQKYFAGRVYDLAKEMGLDIVGVCAPIGDLYLRKSAEADGVPVIPAGMLNADTMPAGVDLGIAAHSFDYVGRATRYKTRLGWIGYHPSLLPRHRGRSSIEWAVRMRDCATGGSIYWLNAGIDRGDIAYQDFLLINPALFSMDPRKAAAELWHDHLLQMGLDLFAKALKDIRAGILKKVPQDPKLSTFEPSTDAKDIFKPDLLMIESPANR